MSDQRPIGVFDSGVGGLTVAREIRRRLPHEDLLYVADTAFCPYGGRPLAEIRDRSIAVTRYLVDRGAKAVVVACNTASGAAIDTLREIFSLPIVGLEPAVKPAASATRSGRVAVLATPATLKTERFNRLVDRHANGIDLVKVACPGFVDLVESGETEGERALDLVREVLAPAIEAGVDHVVLGCTHFPFLRPVISAVMGEDVQILDSGAAVARQVERVLGERGLLATEGGGTFELWTTGDPATVQPVVDHLWGAGVQVQGAGTLTPSISAVRASVPESGAGM